jgi:NADH:ubiquinone oxidoreductase subunit E
MKELKKAIEKIKKETGSVVVALQYAQGAQGFISEDAVAVIADVFGQSRCAVYGTATFYHQFSFAPKGKNVVSVCMGTACFVCGAEAILKAVEGELGIKAGEVTKDRLFSIEHNTRCVGRCDAAPVVLVNDRMIEKATVKGVIDELKILKSN